MSNLPQVPTFGFKQTIKGSFSLRQVEDLIRGLNLLIDQDPQQALISDDELDGNIIDLRDMLVSTLEETKANPITTWEQAKSQPLHGFCI